MKVTEERLQKLIAHAGLTSRRKAEGWIEAGRIAVNGEVVTELGSKADPERDEITVDGRPLPEPPRRYLALHKPAGVLCSLRDRFGRRLITDLLGDDVPQRVYPAGRLDLDSEGLVLMTNDGDLMEGVTRPGGDVGKVYRVAVEGTPSAAELERLEGGIEMDGQTTLPCRIEPRGTAGERWYRVVLHEGKNNQIRRMFDRIGTPVRRLVRRAIGPVELGDLPPGEYRDLRPGELRALRRLSGVPAPETEGGSGREA